MNNYSILVVDDEPDNFEVVETLLLSENYQIYYASSGAEALASLDTFNPDLILLDVLMPGIDGLEVCERLKLMRKWRSVPIIMLTALSGTTAIADCLEAGADDFIRKPVNGIELRARVKSMLRIKKQFDRIESLTKLQQNKISGLETNLSELGIDLAVGFANELSTPLNNILDRLKDLSQKLDSVNGSELLDLVKSAQNSTLELERLNNKFWIYLELALEKNQFDNNETSNIKLIIEQIVIFKSQHLNIQDNLMLDLENGKIAVTNQHCEWIVKELLDNALQSIEPDSIIKISGKVIDRLFHLEISHPILQKIIDTEEQELVLSFKIVKKIVDIYDGNFLLSTEIDIDSPQENSYRTTVKISLPLA
jgi:two-component system, sensor histidine kinase and response regulator